MNIVEFADTLFDSGCFKAVLFTDEWRSSVIYHLKASECDVSHFYPERAVELDLISQPRDNTGPRGRWNPISTAASIYSIFHGKSNPLVHFQDPMTKYGRYLSDMCIMRAARKAGLLHIGVIDVKA